MWKLSGVWVENPVKGNFVDRDRNAGERWRAALPREDGKRASSELLSLWSHISGLSSCFCQ